MMTPASSERQGPMSTLHVPHSPLVLRTFLLARPPWSRSLVLLLLLVLSGVLYSYFFAISWCRRPPHRQHERVFCHHPSMRHTSGPDYVVSLMGEDALFTGESDTDFPFHKHAERCRMLVHAPRLFLFFCLVSAPFHLNGRRCAQIMSILQKVADKPPSLTCTINVCISTEHGSSSLRVAHSFPRRRERGFPSQTHS